MLPCGVSSMSTQVPTKGAASAGVAGVWAEAVSAEPKSAANAMAVLNHVRVDISIGPFIPHWLTVATGPGPPGGA